MRRIWLLVAAAVVLLVGFGAGRWVSLPSAPVPAAISTGDRATPSPSVRPSRGLPDPDRTPGAINPAVRQNNIADTICKVGWSASVRPPSAYTSALKLVQIVQYGYSDHDPRDYQEDHLVPLELGGAPRDPRNLWPEPLAVRLDDGTVIKADEKDALEDELHMRVCGGRLALADAQRLIAGDWYAAATNR